MAIVLDGTTGITTPALDSAARFATADMPLGSVIQVVQAAYGVQVLSTSSTYAGTGLSASITPTSASSKVLAIVAQNGVNKQVSNTGVNLRLVRGATVLSVFSVNAATTNSSSENGVASAACVFLDAPNTTGSVTYSTEFGSSGNSSVAIIQHNSVTSTITLIEIAA
jgi:intracellular sulfur oxidation DsrE/DsrF family protein